MSTNFENFASFPNPLATWPLWGRIPFASSECRSFKHSWASCGFCFGAFPWAFSSRRPWGLALAWGDLKLHAGDASKDDHAEGVVFFTRCIRMSAYVSISTYFSIHVQYIYVYTYIIYAYGPWPCFKTCLCSNMPEHVSQYGSMYL